MGSVVALGLTLAACEREPRPPTQPIPTVAEGGFSAAPAFPAPGTESGRVTVYKTSTCGCCGKWVDHLRDNGFAVDVHDLESVSPVKQHHGLPRQLASCHTAVVDGYVVEGHVPAPVIRRMLDEKPAVKGIAVPRMPEGSPGMEGPHPEAYDVVAYRADGSTSVYEHIEP